MWGGEANLDATSLRDRLRRAMPCDSLVPANYTPLAGAAFVQNGSSMSFPTEALKVLYCQVPLEICSLNAVTLLARVDADHHMTRP